VYVHAETLAKIEGIKEAPFPGSGAHTMVGKFANQCIANILKKSAYKFPIFNFYNQ
jgi:hypothetical protein